MSEPVESAGSGTSEAASDSTAYQTVWRLENDPAADLDTDKTDAILTALSSYVSGQITPADGADLAAAGFDTPLVTVQVTTAEKTVTLRYASGMDGYYLMVEGMVPSIPWTRARCRRFCCRKTHGNRNKITQRAPHQNSGAAHVFCCGM